MPVWHTSRPQLCRASPQQGRECIQPQASLYRHKHTFLLPRKAAQQNTCICTLSPSYLQSQVCLMYAHQYNTWWLYVRMCTVYMLNVHTSWLVYVSIYSTQPHNTVTCWRVGVHSCPPGRTAPWAAAGADGILVVAFRGQVLSVQHCCGHRGMLPQMILQCLCLCEVRWGVCGYVCMCIATGPEVRPSLSVVMEFKKWTPWEFCCNESREISGLVNSNQIILRWHQNEYICLDLELLQGKVFQQDDHPAQGWVAGDL